VKMLPIFAEIRHLLVIHLWFYPYVWSAPSRQCPDGLGGLNPLEYVGGSEYVLTPKNVTFFHSKLLLHYCKFHNMKMNSWTLSLHWSWLMLTMQYHPYVWLASSRQCPPINDFAAPLDLKLSWPKTKLQTVGVYPGGWGSIMTPWEYV